MKNKKMIMNQLRKNNDFWSILIYFIYWKRLNFGEENKYGHKKSRLVPLEMKLSKMI